MKKIIMLFSFAMILVINANAVKVSPVRFDESIARGASKDFVLNLTGSKGSYNQDLLIYPSDLYMSRNGALSFDSIKDSKNSCVKWIKIEKSQISLLEDQTVKLKFKISIPSNASPGEYYAVIMVEPEKFSDVKDKNKPIMLKMKSRVAVVFVLQVPGRSYEKKGEIAEVKILQTDSLVKISSAFQNSGDIHLDVKSEATIRSADGKMTFGTFPLKALSNSKDEAFVFPGAIRDFEGVLKRPLPTGDYLAEVSYNYGYDFRKARKIQKFSINRKVPLDEKNAEFVSLEPKEIRLLVPKGGRRMQVVKITNTDYRSLNVSVAANDWASIAPNNLSLKPGEVRNVMLTLVPMYDQSQNKETVVSFKADRGKATNMKVFVTGIKENLTASPPKDTIINVKKTDKKPTKKSTK